MASDSDVPVTSQANDVAERDFVRLLISLYRDNPHLWDVTNPHYLHKNGRIRTLRQICDTLKTHKPDYTVELLKRKINILRTNFNKQRYKIEARKAEAQDGMFLKDPECGLWYYNDLLFLHEQGNVQSGRATSSTKSTSQMPMQKSLRKKKRSPESSPSPSFRSQESESDLVTKCWAMKLQRLAPDQRMFAEKIINDTLFEAALGTLTRHGVNFIPEHPSFVVCSNEESSECKISPLPE